MNKLDIIKNYSKKEFSDFLEQDNTGQLLELLDKEGIEILNSYKYKEERICYIITFSRYKNEIFFIPGFIDLFLNCDISDFYAIISSLNINTTSFILTSALSLNKDPKFIAELFNYFNRDYQLAVLNNINLPLNVAKILISTSEPAIVNKLFNDYNFDLTDSKSEEYSSFFV